MRIINQRIVTFANVISTTPSMHSKDLAAPPCYTHRTREHNGSHAILFYLSDNKFFKRVDWLRDREVLEFLKILYLVANQSRIYWSVRVFALFVHHL